MELHHVCIAHNSMLMIIKEVEKHLVAVRGFNPRGHGFHKFSILQYLSSVLLLIPPTTTTTFAVTATSTAATAATATIQIKF